MAGTKGRSGGRNRKPPRKLIEGAFRRDDDSTATPPPREIEFAEPPLSCDRARELWAFYVERLGPAGRNILTAEDGAGVVELSELQAELKRRRAAGEGMIPQFSSQLRANLALYSLTPVDRDRAPAIPKPDDGIEYVKPRGATPGWNGGL